MRRAARSVLLCSFVGLLLLPVPVAADAEQDQYEERVVARCTERELRVVKSDRALWVKELESAFPDRVGNPMTEEDYGAWFVLLAGKGEEWRRDSAPNARITELFDKVIQRLELGPVPSIRREEFARYARKALIPGNPPANGNMTDPNEDADKVFRVLDRDGDGVLQREEFTSKLRDDRVRADADANGRIDKTEYREFFRRRVTVAVETAGAKAGDANGRGADAKAAGKPGKGVTLPDWFTTLDADKDMQIALHEWRKGGKSIAVYMEMDLDGDGLLTREEYLRFVQMTEKKTTEPVKKEKN